jgi:uroporphyrin-III C-methyltransferase
VKKIYVGKRAGQPSFSQERINDLIVHACKHYNHVVRLKEGDPFVFGRGHEEQLIAKENNINVEIVPGISSSIAAASSMDIPITLRNVSRSFWVLTGTTSVDQLSRDISTASQTSATLVIMMGFRKLSLLTELFLQFMSADTPIAIVWNASRSDSDMILSTVTQIEHDLIEKDHLPTGPATIIVGEVVRCAYPDYYNMQSELSESNIRMAV